MLQEIIVDNFAGGGGASTGMELALGYSPHIAINHDKAAIAMHKVNHPDTEHYCGSVWDANPRELVRGRPVGLVWFSPDCKHFSKAKGGKPVEKEIRGLAWVAVRWAATVKPRVIILENVEEFTTWGPLTKDGYPDKQKKGKTFKSFVNAFKRLGYDVEWKELLACDYGAPTSRNRFFLIARNDGRAIVWPKPTHGNPESEEFKSGSLKPWHPAAEIIDWTIPATSIFDTSEEIKEKYGVRAVRPLADNTLSRIARGIQKFIIEDPNPFVMPFTITNSNFDRSEDIQAFIDAYMNKSNSGLLTPFIARIGQTGYAKDRLQYRITDPLTTITSKAEHLLITPILGVNTSGHPGSSALEPLRTITTGTQHMLIYPTLAKSDTQPVHETLVATHIIKMRGKNIGQPLKKPIQTITAGGTHFGKVQTFLQRYYESCVAKGQNPTFDKKKLGLVNIRGVEYRIIDIRMRMLKSRELFRGQGFPEEYIIDRDLNGKKISESDQVARCGNAVPPPFAKVLVQANVPELCMGSGNRLTIEKYAQREPGQMAFSM